jgi:hypothetical protein
MNKLASYSAFALVGALCAYGSFEADSGLNLVQIGAQGGNHPHNNSYGSYNQQGYNQYGYNQYGSPPTATSQYSSTPNYVNYNTGQVSPYAQYSTDNYNYGQQG